MLSYFTDAANVAALTSLLAYHIVPEYVELQNLKPGEQIQTAEGGDVTVVYIEGVAHYNKASWLANALEYLSALRNGACSSAFTKEECQWACAKMTGSRCCHSQLENQLKHAPLSKSHNIVMAPCCHYCAYLIW